MRLSEKIARFPVYQPRRPCVIVGTGPSARFYDRWFPAQLGWVLGLNKAHELFATNMNLTIHPELIPDETPASWNAESRETWFVKRGKGVPAGEPVRKVISNDYDGPEVRFDLVKLDPRTAFGPDCPPDALYHGRGIQCTAMHLAARLGFRTIILLGVDMEVIDGEHHAMEQHVRYLGLGSSQVCTEYAEHAQTVRDSLWAAYRAQVLSLNPYLGHGRHHIEHARLKQLHGLSHLPKPIDISNGRTRSKIDPAPEPYRGDPQG